MYFKQAAIYIYIYSYNFLFYKFVISDFRVEYLLPEAHILRATATYNQCVAFGPSVCNIRTLYQVCETIFFNVAFFSRILGYVI